MPSNGTANATSTASSAQASGTCPLNLPSGYLAPHLIVPVNSAAPSQSYGNGYNATISGSGMSTIFNFDIPQSLQGQACTIAFTLPTQAQLQTSSFTTSGSGAIDFKLLSGPAQAGTTYATAPSVSP